MISFFFINIGCNNNITTDDDIYVAVNQTIVELEGETWRNDGSPSYSYLLDQPSNNITFMTDVNEIFKNETINKEFNDRDKKEFIKQLDNFSDFVYNQNRIISKKIIPLSDFEKLFGDKNYFWENYSSKYGSTGYYSISLPLFSYNKEKLLVVVETCGFELDCNGIICLFEKKQGKWKLNKVLYNMT